MLIKYIFMSITKTQYQQFSLQEDIGERYTITNNQIIITLPDTIWYTQRRKQIKQCISQFLKRKKDMFDRRRKHCEL